MQSKDSFRTYVYVGGDVSLKSQQTLTFRANRKTLRGY